MGGGGFYDRLCAAEEVSGFADAWDGALVTHKSLLARAEEEELKQIEAAENDPSTSCAGSPPQAGLGEELKVKRVNPARWSEARERRFFDELVASANVRRAAAAGVSSQAVYARRAKSAMFRRRWDQALVNGRAAIEMGLVAEAKRSLDPDEMDLPRPNRGCRSARRSNPDGAWAGRARARRA